MFRLCCTTVIMKPNEIMAELVLKNITTTAIGKTLGVHRPHVSAVIHGRSRTPRVRAAIAEALGKPVDEVFPESKAREITLKEKFSSISSNLNDLIVLVDRNRDGFLLASKLFPQMREAMSEVEELLFAISDNMAQIKSEVDGLIDTQEPMDSNPRRTGDKTREAA